MPANKIDTIKNLITGGTPTHSQGNKLCWACKHKPIDIRESVALQIPVKEKVNSIL